MEATNNHFSFLPSLKKSHEAKQARTGRYKVFVHLTLHTHHMLTTKCIGYKYIPFNSLRATLALVGNT